MSEQILLFQIDKLTIKKRCYSDMYFDILPTL